MMKIKSSLKFAPIPNDARFAIGEKGLVPYQNEGEVVLKNGNGIGSDPWF